MPGDVQNVDTVARELAELWAPATIAVVNDYDVRVARVEGEFVRHRHPETDEFFLVVRGGLVIEMDDGDVRLGPGDTFVVPKGRFHRPIAESGTTILLLEPSATVNTGDVPSERTADRRVV